jgi:hypothetical protein
VTTYVARRLVERQRALADDPALAARVAPKEAARYRRRRGWRTFGTLLLGFLIGVVTLIVLALAMASRS